MRITICSTNEQDLHDTYKRLLEQYFEIKTRGTWFDVISSKWYQTFEINKIDLDNY